MATSIKTRLGKAGAGKCAEVEDLPPPKPASPRRPERSRFPASFPQTNQKLGIFRGNGEYLVAWGGAMSEVPEAHLICQLITRPLILGKSPLTTEECTLACKRGKEMHAERRLATRRTPAHASSQNPHVIACLPDIRLIVCCKPGLCGDR